MEKIMDFINTNIIYIGLFFCLVVGVWILILFNIRKRKYREYTAKISELDKQKVRVIYTPVELELSKLNKVVKNVDLLVILNGWNEEWENIKTVGIGKISDKIFQIEDSVVRKKFKNLDKEVDECSEMIRDLKKAAQDLHAEIVELSSVEDRIREKVINLKADFRNVKRMFVENEALLYYMKEELELRLNEAVNHIHELEKIVSVNEYAEAEIKVEDIEEEVKVLKILVDRLPDLVMIVKQYIPRKIVTFESMYKKCIDNEVYLEHLLFEDKVKDVSDMIEIIIEKMRKLSFEDVEAEIDAVNIYTDNLYQTLEDETNNFYIYNERYNELKDTIDDSINYVNELQIEVEKVKALYELNDFDEEETKKHKMVVEGILESFNDLPIHPDIDQTYFELIEKLNKLNGKAMDMISKIEDSTAKIMTLRVDEQRAREQIVEIQYLVDQSRKMIKSAKLPVIPENYRVYVADAKDGITYISDELNKVPIVVDDLNQRVETSLELAYKLYNSTKKIIKESMLSEVAIIYGNRYRSNISSVDKELTKAEDLYYLGEYHDSLNTAVNILEKTEPGIYSQLKKFFEKGERINE